MLQVVHIIILSAFVLLVAPPHAHAYIDPGTGSYFFQILLASTLGLAFSVKLYWRQLVEFVKRTLGKEKHETDSTPHAHP